MDRKKLKKLLRDVKAEKVSISDALEILKSFPYKDLGFAKIDTHRDLRKGFPEVILCKGKTLKQISKIVEALSSQNELYNEFIMATKANEEIYETIRSIRKDAVYYETARIVTAGKGRWCYGSNTDNKASNSDTRSKISDDKTHHALISEGKILVVSAGTSDMPIAEEAAVTSEIMRNAVERLYDIGVAGIHRLLNNKEKLFHASVIIVVAGMDGALASIVGGIVDKPVIAVPTSVGYGAGFEGLAPLLTMLNCCAPGVVVVNIDNGFGAGYFASTINH